MTARQGLVTVASCPGTFKTSIDKLEQVQRRKAGGKPVWAEQLKELQMFPRSQDDVNVLKGAVITLKSLLSGFRENKGLPQDLGFLQN